MTGDIKEYHCDVRARIGELMEIRRDHWWTVGNNQDNEGVRIALASNFETYAIPWLDSFQGQRELLEHFKDHSMLFDAAVMEHLLKGNQVTEYLTKAHERANPIF